MAPFHENFVILQAWRPQIEAETCLDNLEMKNQAGYVKCELCSSHMDLFHDDFLFFVMLRSSPDLDLIQIRSGSGSDLDLDPIPIRSGSGSDPDPDPIQIQIRSRPKNKVFKN